MDDTHALEMEIGEVSAAIYAQSDRLDFIEYKMRRGKKSWLLQPSDFSPGQPGAAMLENLRRG